MDINIKLLSSILDALGRPAALIAHKTILCSNEDFRKHFDKRLIYALPQAEEDPILLSMNYNDCTWDISITPHENCQLVILTMSSPTESKLPNPISSIREPLTAIMAALSVLRRELDSNSAMDAYISIMNRSCYRLVRAVNEFELYNSINDGTLLGNFQPVSLGSLFAKTADELSPYMDSLGINFDYSCDDDILVSADSDKLETAVLQLLRNSAQHTPPGGKISLSVTISGSNINITVIDNGSGIPPEKMSSLFQPQPSSSENRENLGFGLFVAKSIAQLHGGRIIILPSKQHGTKVIISIPYIPDSTLFAPSMEIGSGVSNVKMEFAGIVKSDVF